MYLIQSVSIHPFNNTIGFYEKKGIKKMVENEIFLYLIENKKIVKKKKNIKNDLESTIAISWSKLNGKGLNNGILRYLFQNWRKLITFEDNVAT